VLGEGSTTDVPPAAFGRFRVLHQIAVGSLGPVFRGEDPDTHQAVAITHIQLELARPAALLAVGALRDLVGALPDHPSIAQPLDAGLHEKTPYFVTIFADGEPLDVALDTYGPAAIPDALPRIEALARALDLAAESHIYHGTLEPRDILVSADETILTGLGILQAFESHVAVPARRGVCVAPEIQAGGAATAQADRFSLAAIAYQWLFGRPAEIVDDHRVEVPALPDVDRDGLSETFSRGLALRANDRFATCVAFVTSLRRATTGGSGRRRGAPAAAPIRSTSGRGRNVSPEGSLPFESDAIAAAEAREPDVLMTATPAAPIADLELAPGARTHLQAPSLAGLADTSPSPASGGRFTFSSVAAALVGGVAMGAVGGYLLARWPDARAGRASITDAPPSASRDAGREFTESPLPAVPAALNESPSTAALADPAAVPAPPSDLVDRTAAAPAPAARAETARLLVRSSPSGATVAVDGATRGTTPLALRDLPFGTRRVSVGRAGYDTVERRVSLSADRPSRSVEVVLRATQAPKSSAPVVPAATTGALSVESRPAGAAVAIDGRLAGKTPLLLDRLAPGTHTVRIERSGYRPWATTIDVKPGDRARVAASLVGGRDPE
jgi:hypothetical protein